MDHLLPTLADRSIRRACGFAGFGVGSVMLALSFDLPLAFRFGGMLFALLCLGLLWTAWRAPYRDVRRGELWIELQAVCDGPPPYARDVAQALLSSVMRQRLIWHAERVGIAALAMELLSILAGLLLG